MNTILPLIIIAAFMIAAGLFVWNKNRKPKIPEYNYPQYVTQKCDGLRPTQWLTIEATAVGPFADDATLTPFFQRKGDDWSARGPMETYRWWASSNTIKLVPGPIRVKVPFGGYWTAVLSSTSVGNHEKYLDALENAARVGFTVGDITGLGHGDNPPGAITDVRITISNGE